MSATANTPSANAVALTQTPAAAGPITLNGALVITNAIVPAQGPALSPGVPLKLANILVPSQGLPTYGTAAPLPQAQQITLTSAGNDSTLVWTVNGLDYNGSPLSETLPGGNAAAVTSLYAYSQINSIVASKGTAGAITVGIAATQFSPWIIASHQKQDYQFHVRCFIPVGNTGTYDVQATSDVNLMEQLGGYADDIITVATAQTGNIDSFPNAPYIAYRLRVTAGGPVIMRLGMTTTA